MRTADVERLMGLPRSTLRLYERKGLISPDRSPKGYRIYQERELERLRDIRIGQKLGFTLSELATLMESRADTGSDRDDDQAIVAERLEACEAELDQLTCIRDYLRTVQIWLEQGRPSPKPVFDMSL